MTASAHQNMHCLHHLICSVAVACHLRLACTATSLARGDPRPPWNNIPSANAHHAKAHSCNSSIQVLQALHETKQECAYVQEQAQQLHEERIKHLPVYETTGQVIDQPHTLRASSASVQSLYSELFLGHSVSKRPDTAYEGMGSVVASSLISSAAISCADSDTSKESVPLCGSSLHAAGGGGQQGLVQPGSVASPCCIKEVDGCQVGPSPPMKGCRKVRPSPKSRQLSQSAWL